jgi:hypothetical protein
VGRSVFTQIGAKSTALVPPRHRWNSYLVKKEGLTMFSKKCLGSRAALKMANMVKMIGGVCRSAQEMRNVPESAGRHPRFGSKTKPGRFPQVVGQRNAAGSFFALESNDGQRSALH